MGPYYTFRLIFSVNICSVTVQLAKSRREELIKMLLRSSDLPSVMTVRSEELDEATKHKAQRLSVAFIKETDLDFKSG